MDRKEETSIQRTREPLAGEPDLKDEYRPPPPRNVSLVPGSTRSPWRPDRRDGTIQRIARARPQADATRNDLPQRPFELWTAFEFGRGSVDEHIQLRIEFHHLGRSDQAYTCYTESQGFLISQRIEIRHLDIEHGDYIGVYERNLAEVKDEPGTGTPKRWRK